MNIITNFQAKTSFNGIDFLKRLEKNQIKANISGINICLTMENNKTKLEAHLQASTKDEARKVFEEAIDRLKSIVVFCTRKPVVFEAINITDLDNKSAITNLNSSICVINPADLPNPNHVLSYLQIINRSTHLDNALYYYRLAILAEDNKDAILNLYKVVESIIGYPGRNESRFKTSLKKLNMENNLSSLINLRKLRNSFDAGHSAGGEIDGNCSHRDIIIDSDIVEKKKEVIQNLILSTICYFAHGNDIADIFIPRVL